MKNENQSKKKKILLASLLSVAVLGGVGTSAYFLTRGGDSNRQPEELTQSTLASSAEFVEAKADKGKREKESKSAKNSESKTSDSSSNSSSSETKSSSSSSSGDRDNKRDSVPISESRIQNTAEAGSKPIAPISQVRDLVARPDSQTRPSRTADKNNRAPGSRPIGINSAVAKAQEDEAKRLAELEAKRNQELEERRAAAERERQAAEREKNNNTVTPVVPITPQPVQPVTPTPQPTPQPEQPTRPVAPTPEPEKPSQPVTPTPQPEQPVTPTPQPTPQPEQPTRPVAPTPEPENPTQPVTPTPQPVTPTPVTPTPQPESKPEEKTANNLVVRITNQEELNNYLKETGRDLSGDTVTFDLTEDIRFPQNTYTIKNAETIWQFVGNGKAVTVDLNGATFLSGNGGDFVWLTTGNFGSNEQPSHFKNATFIGSVKSSTGEDGSVQFLSGGTEDHRSIFGGGKSKGAGYFSNLLLKASNIRFTDLTFNNAQAEHAHIFDVSGSDHIWFERNVFAGYGGAELNDRIIEKRWNKNPHSVYSEAIQLDSAIQGTFGSMNRTGTILEGLTLDGTPTTHVTVADNAFTSYSGWTGEDISNGNTADSSKIVRNLSAGVGSHTRGNAPYTNISVRGNKFENTSDFKNNATRDRHLAYPVHFEGIDDIEKNGIVVASNGFERITPKLDSGVLVNKRVGFSAPATNGENVPKEQPKNPEEAESIRKENLEKNQNTGADAVTKPAGKPSETASGLSEKQTAVKKEVYQELVAKGLGSKAAIGVIQNLINISNLDPTLAMNGTTKVGEDFAQSEDKKAIIDGQEPGKTFGLLQLGGSRKAGFVAWANKNQKNVYSAKDQIDWLFEGDNKAALTAIAKSDSSLQAAKRFHNWMTNPDNSDFDREPERPLPENLKDEKVLSALSEELVKPDGEKPSTL